MAQHLRSYPKPTSQRGRAGFTLVEIAVVLAVLGFLLAIVAGIATSMVGQQRREATRQRLAAMEITITLFVSQNKRLPCPADGRIDGTSASAGLEERSGGGVCQIGGTANNQRYGVVPWRTLGIAEPDATDGWGNRLTYRVAPELAVDNRMDFTGCDPGASATSTLVNACGSPCPSGTWPTGCTNPRDVTSGKGLKVRNLSSATLIMDPSPAGGPPPPPSTGAAYIVISHGENGEGAYNNLGFLQGGTVASGTLESANNAADVAFTYATSNATVAFVDDFPSYAAGAGHFDDFLLRPSILAVATKAGLGPRAH